MDSHRSGLLPESELDTCILHVRGQMVIIDGDLARLYGVTTKALVQAVKRNPLRFPDDFVFRLSLQEAENLKQASGVSRWGGARRPPLAFTEHGVAMLASVLRSDRAALVNVEIVRAFVRLRRRAADIADLAARLDEMERGYDGQFPAGVRGDPAHDRAARRNFVPADRVLNTGKLEVTVCDLKLAR